MTDATDTIDTSESTESTEAIEPTEPNVDVGAGSRAGTLDRGASDVLSVVLLAPVAIALALLVVFLGRQVDARAQVHTAAESAAQAAALSRSPAGAHQAATEIAGAMLVDVDTCAEPSVTVDLGDFRPGGTVSVTVRCAVGARGLEIIDPPVAATTVTATAAIDPYRGVAP